MKLATSGFALGAVLLVWSAPALAGSGCPYSQTTTADLQKITVEQLASYVTAKDVAKRARYAVYDANGKDTRAKFGVIPGAALLSHYAEYNPQNELPGDKAANLVFYCSNTKCTAAPKAAQKALDNGYQSVFVLTAGIMGWSEAGQPTTKVKTTS